MKLWKHNKERGILITASGGDIPHNKHPPPSYKKRLAFPVLVCAEKSTENQLAIEKSTTSHYNTLQDDTQRGFLIDWAKIPVNQRFSRYDTQRKSRLHDITKNTVDNLKKYWAFLQKGMDLSVLRRIIKITDSATIFGICFVFIYAQLAGLLL